MPCVPVVRPPFPTIQQYTVYVDNIPVGEVDYDGTDTPFEAAEIVAGVGGWVFRDGARVTKMEHTVGVSIHYGSDRPKQPKTR